MIFMDTVPNQVSVDEDNKLQESVLRYSKQTLQAMAEARRISKESDVPGYTSMDTLKEALDG